MPFQGSAHQSPRQGRASKRVIAHKVFCAKGFRHRCLTLEASVSIAHLPTLVFRMKTASHLSFAHGRMCVTHSISALRQTIQVVAFQSHLTALAIKIAIASLMNIAKTPLCVPLTMKPVFLRWENVKAGHLLVACKTRIACRDHLQHFAWRASHAKPQRALLQIKKGFA